MGGSPVGQPGQGEGDHALQEVGACSQASLFGPSPPPRHRSEGTLVFVLGCETPGSREWETVCRAHCLHFQTVPGKTKRDGFMRVTQSYYFQATEELWVLRVLSSQACRRSWAAKGLGEGAEPSTR